MHGKLSEAVKLYDKLLTAQVAHPPWRASTSIQPAPQQQAPASYGQWTIPPQAAPISPQMQPVQPTYFQGPAAEGPVASTSDQYGQPVANYGQYSQQSQSYGATPPPPVSIPQYQGYPSTEAPATPAPAPVHSPPPISTQQTVYSPPPPPSFSSQVQSPAAQSSLTRHNSIAAYPSQQTNGQSSYLSRAKTMSHAPQQLQQLQQAAVPQQPLPNFPVAPTGPPQAYQTYASPPPVEEREALLIDL